MLIIIRNNAISCVIFVLMVVATAVRGDKEIRLQTAKIFESNRMGTLNPLFLSQLSQLFEPDIFIETGTYMGDTTFEAQNFFKEVHTIELSKQLYERAVARFVGQDTITVHNGKSEVVLKKILPYLKNKKILFWLDAHWSGGPTAQGEYNTAFLNEMEEIKKSGIIGTLNPMPAVKESISSENTLPIILVDDLRLFRSASETAIINTQFTNSKHVGYPLFDDIYKMLSVDIDYEFVVYGDIALAFPKNAGIALSPVLKAMTLSKLFDCSEHYASHDFNEIIDAELAIVHTANQDEIVAIKNLYTHLYPSSTIPVKSFKLWYGLVLIGEKQYDQALKIFEELVAEGVPAWRVAPYVAIAKK